MSKKLLIVESPAKARTIGQYLGSGFEVVASYGHVRDLPSSVLGVDVEKNFEPTYVIAPKSRKNVTAIAKPAKTADEIYLATDLDREGEAIAWHIVQAAKLDKLKDFKSKVKRITFHEISKSSILEAISKPREIDMGLVDAQQARRILDRLVGYSLSPLLWKKVYKGLSAGRVQSVAVRMVVEREREIQAFKPEEYWSITALLQKDAKNFITRLVEIKSQKLDKIAIKSEKDAAEILKKLEKGQYEVLSVDSKKEKRNPYAPFTTSTMQQEAANVLGFSAKQTMRLAQGLYESGYITYMRTDSVSLSQNAVSNIRKYIENSYGANYLPESARGFKTKSRHAQEAHEAIRPVEVEKTALLIKGLEPKAAKLYDLIWRRALASQMKEAQIGIIDIRTKCYDYIFGARGQSVIFDGFLKLYQQKVTETELPTMKIGDILKLLELKKEQHFTEPPARYSEATLIKALEEKGIGRPSTYAPTMSTIQDRGYVIKDKGRLKPEDVGFIVNDILVDNFPDIVNYDFTAHVEDDLDEIAEGKRVWQEVIAEFYGPFEKLLKDKSDKIEKKSMDEELEEKCPDCGKNLVMKHSRSGKFIGCTGFPDCRFTRSFVKPEIQVKIDLANNSIKDRACPKCKGELRVVSGRFGPFIGCSKYPDCKYIEKIAKQNNQ
ncbi:MAG: type I DNA topoisomerase [Candidatus Methylomirabilota bacterium]